MTCDIAGKQQQAMLGKRNAARIRRVNAFCYLQILQPVQVHLKTHKIKAECAKTKKKLKTKAHFNVDTLLFVHLLLPCSRSVLADTTCWRKGGYGWHLQSKGLELRSALPSSGWIWNAIAGTPLEICVSRNARRSCKVSLNGRKGVQCPLLFIASAVSLFLHFGFKMLNVATTLP